MSKKSSTFADENKIQMLMDTEIKFDQRNYRKHSKKNKDLIRKSLVELGAGRSVVIDNENELVAGNGVYEQAQALKMPVRIVETDGSELVVVKRTDLGTQDDSKGLTDDEVRAIVELGFKCKQNPAANDFAECRFGKPCFDPDGKEHKCCLCKAQGGFFGVSKCIVPCVMYNSNKQGELIWNRYGFAI